MFGIKRLTRVMEQISISLNSIHRDMENQLIMDQQELNYYQKEDRKDFLKSLKELNSIKDNKDLRKTLKIFIKDLEKSIDSN